MARKLSGRSRLLFSFVTSVASGVFLWYRRDSEKSPGLRTTVMSSLLSTLGIVVGYKLAARYLGSDDLDVDIDVA